MKTYRKKRGWTLGRLAEEAFLNPDRKGHISQIENGKYKLSSLNVRQVCDALGIPDAAISRMPELPSPSEDDVDLELAGLTIEISSKPEVPEFVNRLSRSKMVAACARFGVRNANYRSEFSLKESLKEKLYDFLEFDLKLQELHNSLKSARSSLNSLDFDAVENDLAGFQSSDENTILMAKNALLRGRDDQASEIFHGIASNRTSPKESAADLLEFASILYDHGFRFRSSSLALSIDMLREAAMQISRKEKSLWGTIHHRLGNSLLNLGRRGGGRRGYNLVQEGIEAYEEALNVRSKRRNRIDWARTKSALGNAKTYFMSCNTWVYRENEEWIEDVMDRHLASFRSGMDCLREALGVLTEAGDPSDWASAKNNLACASHSMVGSDLDELRDIEEFYRDALRAWKRVGKLKEVGLATLNAANALSDQAKWMNTGAGDTFDRSYTDYAKAEEFLPIDEYPFDWALVHQCWGIALHQHFVTLDDDKIEIDLLTQSKQHLDQARKVIARSNYPDRYDSIESRRAQVDELLNELQCGADSP